MTYPNKTHYTEHFSRRELDCHCGCDAPPSVEKNLTALAIELERLRKQLGNVPLHINSGYRCPAYNKKIGGAPQSQHMLGKAADLSGRTVRPLQIRDAASVVPSFRAGGIGLYDTFCHVDIRPTIARWDERKWSK